MTYGQVWWPILGICALQLTHPSAHTQQWTHTHREHTPRAVGSHLCCGARGAVGGWVPCSRAPQSWYWRWRERWTFTPPTYNSYRTWDSNSQPLDYESNSLTIRPRLPRNGDKGRLRTFWQAKVPLVYLIRKARSLISGNWGDVSNQRMRRAVCLRTPPGDLMSAVGPSLMHVGSTKAALQ